ncbi:alkanesulfonate monooxygenase [Sphingomonas sp. DBB INV C78]|uniref:LLM class flavin-dependent oxidoreductase n=1 Tax=Sphingomonas sp. DBB INV C78 TaxID=3349434 RepID=UPI0036D2CDD0
MTTQTYWQLDPAAEPSRSEAGERPRWQPVIRDVRTAALNRYDHYAQIARAAAITGFDGLFVRHSEPHDDSQIIAAAVARATPRLLLVPEFPASVGSAVYAAKQAVSFQRLAHGRLGWAIAPDAGSEDRTRIGDHVADEDLVARTEEFLTVARGVHGTRPFTFKGQYFEVAGGGFEEPLNRVAFPKVFLRDEGEEAWGLSARHADVHLFEAAPVDVLRHAIEALDRQALAAGRSIEFGVVASVLARESDEEAREAGTADIAGSYEGVAAQLAALSAIGIQHFTLSASPSLEEAYRIGQFVLPRFRAAADPARAAA